MDFDEYQAFTRTTDLFPPITGKYDQVDLIEYRTLCLCGEAGELANKVKKIRRDHDNLVTPEMKASIIHEMGDILWYLSILCDILNTSLNTVAVRNMGMLSRRKAEGKIQGSGEQR